MAGSPPNFHKMDSRSAYTQGVLKVKVKVKGHVIRALSWILGMSYSVIDGLVVISSRRTTGQPDIREEITMMIDESLLHRFNNFKYCVVSYF